MSKLAFSRLLLVVLLHLAAIPLISQTTFTGAVSTNWYDPGNWDNGLPGPGNDATIPFGLSADGFWGFVNGGITNNGTLTINSFYISDPSFITAFGPLKTISRILYCRGKGLIFCDRLKMEC